MKINDNDRWFYEENFPELEISIDKWFDIYFDPGNCEMSIKDKIDLNLWLATQLIKKADIVDLEVNGCVYSQAEKAFKRRVAILYREYSKIFKMSAAKLMHEKMRT